MDLQGKGPNGRNCVVRIHPDGIWFIFGKEYTGFSWDQIRQVSFDDPGRTKANVGAIVAFGVLGMASRSSYSVCTVVTTTTADWAFEFPGAVGQWRASLRELLQTVPGLQGKLYVDGDLNGIPTAGAPTQTAPQSAGWYPDPLGRPALRWHDGSEWTDHTTALPEPPPI